jgi:antitoxin PrlF
MRATLTTKGRVTIPKHIRDAWNLQPGAAVEYSVNSDGDVVLHWLRQTLRGKPRKDRFDAVRGLAEVCWRTDELVKLLRAEQ